MSEFIILSLNLLSTRVNNCAMTVFGEFCKAARDFAGRPFLHLLQTGEDLSYGHALPQIERLRAAYAGAGYGLGHRVGLALDNRPEFFLHFLALNALGVSVIPLSAALGTDEIAFIVARGDADLVVSLPQHREAMQMALKKNDPPVPLALSENPAALPAPGSPAKKGAPEAASEAAMLFTSGTTGIPKGCLLSNEYFTGLGAWYADMGGLCSLEPGAERLITPLPVNHMNAMACSFMAMVMAGGCIIQLDRFHPSTWWASVRNTRATILHYLGVMPAMLLSAPPEPHDDFSTQIKFGFGAGVDPKHHGAFEARFGFPLIEAWAMSETGAGACIAASHEPRHVGTRCFGRALPGLETRLVDEAGDDVAPGAPGELLVRRTGPNPRHYFFSGYYKDPQATDEAWAGGWFHTGDVVRIDKAGYYYFIDRRKNITRRSGENIAAVEVEGALLQNPCVANCAVAPVPDEIRGEEVMALIMTGNAEQETRETAENIAAACLNALAYHKAPGYIAFVDALPMTGSQKVQRGHVKEICRALAARGACYDVTTLKSRARHKQKGARA